MKRTAIAASLLLAAAVVFGFGAGEDGEFDYDGIREISVDAATFEVDVQGTRGRQTSIDIHNESDNYRVLHSRSGDRLEIWVEGRFSLFSRAPRGRISLLVPGDVQLRLRTSTGEVSVRDITADNMEVNTTTGAVRLQDIAATVGLETSTGSVEIQDSSGRFNVTTSTGSISLSRTTGDVNSQSSTGRHEYENIIGDIVARSTTGRIRIDGMQGTLDLDTSTGSQEGRGIVLTGDSSFESSTGSIQMDFVGDVEQLEFDLRSTTGSLRVGREESQRQLYLGGTGFTIRGKSSTGSQEYF